MSRPEAESAIDSCDPEHGHGLRADALPAPQFQRRILSALDALDDVTARSLGPFRLQVEHAGKVFRLRIDEVFKNYRHERIEVDDAIEELKAAAGLPGAAMESSGPFPRLAPRGSLDPQIYSEACPFDEDLCVFYVRDLPHGHIPIFRDQVEESRAGWGRPSALRAQASTALSIRSQQVPAEGKGKGLHAVIGFNSGDGFDAARALLPDLMQALDEWLPGRPLVAIPTRDVLMAVGDEDPAFLAEAREHVRRLYEESPERLSPRWYRIGEAGLERE